MDWTSLIGPAVVAAVISGLVSVIGIWISARTTRAVHAEKLAFDRKQAKRRVTAEIALAEKKLALDRALAAWKRKTELAEEVLTDFYQAKEIIEAARSPGGFGGEGETRPREAWETEQDTRRLDSYYRTVERLKRKDEFFTQLMARRYRVISLFGAKAGQPFLDFWRIRGEILIAVRMLLATQQFPHDGSLPHDRRHCEIIIGWPHDNQDPIAPRLEKIIAEIEAICRPVIEDLPQ